MRRARLIRMLVPAAVLAGVYAAASIVRGGAGNRPPFRDRGLPPLGDLRAGTVLAWGQLYSWLDAGGVTHGRGARWPVEVGPLPPVAAVAAGFGLSIGLAADGTVWSWGSDYTGHLGARGEAPRRDPRRVEGLEDIAAVYAAGARALALRHDGSLWEWRWHGLRDVAVPPAPVEGLPPIAAAAAGRRHGLALSRDGDVWTWGDNRCGQLGDGTTDSSPGAVPVRGLDGATALAAGDEHSAAVRADGTVWAWGCDLPDSSPRLRPVPVGGLAGIRSVAAGWRRTLALRADGTVWVWGDNRSIYRSGRWLAPREDPEERTIPAPERVPGLEGITAVAQSDTLSLALARDGTLWAWGNNANGEVGDGTGDIRRRPVRVATERPIAAAAAGGFRALAITA